ncbi:hypothetical protein HYPBUDRAFT_103016 [Hyphopichia burtonii NRRL Y-1933]|uniref:RBR-type E3 ubiquitin transferase n=1 Tax=Hyphopichia burtonii NRRL Y-1933 TaxID=984485 RepID=A0A1E4RPY3_9ASCO|nr:hypothetical protein HYPBUDRAFT_103016 [Hyphopichia burtonii NRRL Y-1933]ODV69286.1 hypothetical protein HYPBUDRAFT_103016 [Hyphopichia burtonii NRRL Y-1933]
MSDDLSDNFSYEEGSSSAFEFEDEDDLLQSEGESDYDGDTTVTNRNRNTTDSFEPKFHPWTFEGFIQHQFIDKAAELHQRQLPQCTLGDILIMLQTKNWQPENVINDFYDNPTKLRNQCGLPQPPIDKKVGLIEVDNFECAICAESYEHTQIYALACNHRYCGECYKSYVNMHISSGKLITCMNLECPLTISHGDVALLASQGKDEESIIKPKIDLISNPLLISTVSNYIDTHRKQYKWCPATDCNNLIELDRDAIANHDEDENRDIDLTHVLNVSCPENHEFCYKCHRENHLPCPCWIVDLWVQKCKDDSETANWIQANTQPCPECDSLIEKNGGCNHLTCRKCKYEFCWICLGNWKDHGRDFYQCNRFDPNVVKELQKGKELKRLSLRRYLHFYKRFTVHESSMKGDQRIIERVDEKMKSYMELQTKNLTNESSLSWVDVQFLHDAIRALTNGRKTLKWTYCFAFYLENTNFSEIFESMQDFLNSTVEELSKIFEEINAKKNNTNSKNYEVITKYRNEIMSLSKLISQRQRMLIDCAQTGLQQGLLKFA